MYAQGRQVAELVPKVLCNWVNLSSLHFMADGDAMVSMALGTLAWAVHLCHSAYLIERQKGSTQHVTGKTD